MINRAAALALPLTATCVLVTLNDSAMHRFTRRREASARRAWRVSVKDKILKRMTQL